jgi:hypothetical protein
MSRLNQRFVKLIERRRPSEKYAGQVRHCLPAAPGRIRCGGPAVAGRIHMSSFGRPLANATSRDQENQYAGPQATEAGGLGNDGDVVRKGEWPSEESW